MKYALGPNGFPVKEDKEGNLVEMVKDEEWADDKIETVIVPMIIRRADKIIEAEYKKLWDKVWWNRHMSHHKPGPIHEAHDGSIGCEAAKCFEDRYGLEYLNPGDDVEWGITQGKMMALAWVMGSEWEGSGDT